MNRPALLGRLERLGRLARRAGWLAVAGLGVALALDAWRLSQALDVNRQLARWSAALAAAPGDARSIAAPGAAAGGKPSAPGADPRVWIVAAREPARAGRTVEAAALLRRAADAADAGGPLRAIALYDLGNVYLRAAFQLKDGGADALALPLFELAKESYRAALYERSDLWDAKFNLELSLRAVPDPDPDDAGAPPVMTGERAVTTMRALSLGLP